jgi:transposase-like protein
MSGTKGMLHYAVETKQKAVAMVVEEHRSYAAIARLFTFIGSEVSVQNHQRSRSSFHGQERN